MKMVEVWVETILPGKTAEEVESACKEWGQTWKNKGLNPVRIMRPDSGRILNKTIGVIEYDSHAEREKMWANIPDDFRAEMRKFRNKLYEVNALEHYCYNVIE